jgi:two-component system NtrC family sensor kinase
MASAASSPRLSVQTKVLIPVLACLVLLPLILVGIVQLYINREQSNDGRRTLATADGVFQQLLDSRQQELLARFRNGIIAPNYTAALQRAATQLGTKNSAVAEGTIREFLSERLDDFEDDCEVMLFLHELPEGKTAAVGHARASSFPLEEFAQAAKPVWSQAQKGESTVGSISLAGAAFYVVAVPVRVTPDEPPIGVLTMGVRISEAALQKLKKLTNTEIILVSGTQVIGSTLSALDSGWMRQIERPVVSESKRDAPRVADQLVTLKDQHFMALSSAFGRSGPQQGFDYVMLSSFEESLRMQQDLQRMLLEVSACALIFSAAAVWFFVHRFIQPLRELRDTAEAVGRGDFSRRVERFSNDEVGDLAQTFNRMTVNLRSSRSELETTVETLKTTQAQLVQSEKLSAVGQFVAGIAHELNNPLTAVIGFSDLLSQTSTDEKVRPHLELIAKSAHRCHKIIQNLLGFARQHVSERKITRIKDAIEEVLEIMAYDLRTSNIEVVKDFQVEVPAILADCHQIQQVFVNIIGNARQAIQAVRPVGQIQVRIKADASWVKVEFSDNGPGIPPENLSRIFDPFFTTKPVGKGTGLGLSLSYGIIQEHGGQITVKSELGRGATFVIELPAALDATGLREDTEIAPVRRTGPAAPSGKAILVVDDEEWILALAKELLTSEGHAVETVPGGEQGIEALRRRDFDVIVCDWKMPGLNGMQFYEHLMATDPATAERVLFMSGDVVNDDFQAFLRRHGRQCLAKPFAIEDFQNAVAKMLEPH